MFRRIVSVVLAAAIALEPVAAAAQQMPYYRHNRTTYAGPVTPPTPTNPTNTDPVRGTGELAIYLPVQVRARYGVPFSLQLRAQNGEGDVTWTSVGTALPEGLTFNPSTGFLTGVPTRIQTSPKARFAGVDATGKTGESPSLIIDVQPVPSVAVEAVYTGQTGTDLAIRPVASPVFGSQAWTLAGNLPLGLSLDPNTGRITGTPRQQGTYANLKLSVTDADGASGTSAAFTINVTSNIAITGLPSKIPARLARAMTPVRVFASGTPGPYQWSVSAEGASLPEGLALNPTTGAISGTPVASGSTSGVALRIVDTRTGESTISPPFTVAVADAPSISVAASYTVRQGRGSVVNLVPVGNNLLAGGYWSTTSKPPGYGFEYSTGAITGPTGSIASYAGITFKVIDMFDGASATSSATTLNIWPELTVGGPAIPAAKVDTPFSMQPPVASGLMGVPTWSVIGALPEGLTLNPATGVITGTPTKVSRLRVSMSLVDGADKATASTIPFDINIQPEDAELPFEIVGVPAQIPGVTERFMSFTPTVTGAKGAVTWSLVGTLPSWALFEPSTGSIAGVPTTTGVTSGLVLSVSDASTGATVSSSPFALEITPNAPMTVAIAESMQGEVAETFAGASPVVRNSRGTTSFALAAGHAPEGLQLNPETGSFQGIPEISGTVSGLSILATDNFGSAAVSNPFAVNVAPSATSPVATMASRTATTHEPFSAAPSARNAFAPLTWVLESGSLPSWATFNPTTGAISGTPPQTGLSGPFVLKVTDRFGRAARTSEFSISTVDAPAFSISMAPTVYGVAGSTFIERPIVIGAKGATTFTLTAGTLPAGLILSPDTGAINGSPNASGLTNGLRISARDTTNAVVSTDAFSISVSPSPLKVSEYPSELRSTYQVAYIAPRPQVSGIVGSAVWTLANGTLPSWATLDSETGQISGTPDAVATASGLRLRVADSNGTNATTGFFSLIAARPTLSAGSHGALAYHTGEPTTIPAPAARGVVGAPTWTLTSGTLPVGLALDPSTGVISGAVASPLTASNLILTVRDAFDGATASTPAFSIAMLGAPVVTVLPTYQGSRGASFEALPAVTNAIGAQAWTLVSGSLPAWATFDATTGRIGGTPQEVSSATGLIVRMTDATGAVAQSEPFSIVVGAGMYATTQSTTYNPRVGIAFATDAPQVFKNAGAVTWSIASGSLPAWATLNVATGIISGTADAPSKFTIVLRLTDASSASATTQPLTFDATGVPVVSIASKSLRVGAPLTLAPVVTGAVGEQFWQVVSGTLPAWMKLDARTGLLTGSPTEIGSVTLALQVRDEDGAVGTSAAFTITVTPGLTIAGKAPSYGGRINQLFSMAPVTIGNAQGALSWTMAIGSGMPGGLIYNESNGTLSGRPTNSGTMTANLVVRDASDQATLNVSLNLVIAQELTISEPVTASFHEGQAFATRALAVTGQRGTLSWKLVGGTLPAWATFATETGIISGTAPNAITSVGPLVITVTDSEDQITSPSVSFSIEIIPGLGVANLPTSFSARFGTLFTSARPTAVSPVGAPVWSWGQGSAPPAWLNLDPATGILSGTPVALGSFSGLTLVVKDATNQIASSAPFTLSVFSQPSIAVSESTLKRRVGDMVSITSTATGLSGTPRWSVVLQPGSDPIPAGLVFNEQTGSLSGTPTAAGSAFFLIRVVDGQDLAMAESQMISLTVSPAFSLTGMASSYFGRVGEFLILDQPTAQGQAGQGVAYSFTLREGVLPAGFGMVDNTTGLIRGVPSLPLQTTIGTLSATDSFDQKTAATSFTIGIRPALSVAGVTDVALRNDQAVGTSTFTPAAQNLFYPGTAQWTLSGTLPNGVTFNSSNGTLSGTPTGYAASQTFAGLTLTLKDPTDGSQVTSAPFKVTVNTGISIQTTQPSYTVRAGRQFVAAAPTISGLSGTGTWSIVTRAGTALPYTIAANGAVTVSPSAAANGGWAYDLIVTDPVDGNTSAVTITATVAPVTVLAYQGNTAVAPGQQVSIPASVSNNRGALQFSLASGALPAGITLDGTTGLISGSSSALGSVTVTVKAIDIDGYEAVSGAVRIAVSNAPDVFVGGIPSGKIGKPFVLAPTTNAASVTWSMTGTLPAGLSFNSATGAITGQPTAVGTSGSIVISARNTATSVTGHPSPSRSRWYPATRSRSLARLQNGARDWPRRPSCRLPTQWVLSAGRSRVACCRPASRLTARQARFPACRPNSGPIASA
ncbi:putative Ig domain-containing protein [Bosea sp. RAC05]|uniref:putative Ig domain-containing protein n=1 Tax=Bosea sp. RAC05 TaxID=1842539 RepID=UPI00083DBAC5|nr:putative Ig domain-containing protein [Bosea sp. RAC05]AOG03059.1 putative Ig domain protein [Bosea sp. RAC05]